MSNLHHAKHDTHQLPQAAAEASNPANTNLCNSPTLIDSRADVINRGSTSLIHLLPSGHIRKNVYPEHFDKARFTKRLEIESRIYTRLPKKHPRLLEMFSYSREEELVLEFMPRGDLGKYLRGEDPRTQRSGELRGARETVEVSPKQRLQWACDAAEGLALLHEHGVWHCDLRAMNFLVDEGLRLRVIDFEGSSIDGGWRRLWRRRGSFCRGGGRTRRRRGRRYLRWGRWFMRS